jgi:predicted ATP-grasp superfamily ATP-dependent carboligase
MVSTGIGVVRSLGREGIPVITASPERRAMSAYSRYVREHVVVPDPARDPAGFTRELSRMGQALAPVPVLFLTTDEQVMQVNALQDDLRPYFRYSYLKQSALSKCVNKLAMFEAARACGVPVPDTVLVPAAARDLSSVKHLRPPYAVKPASWVKEEGGSFRRSASFLREFRRKAFRVADSAALLDVLARCAACDCDVVVQEEVEGSCDRIYGVSLYADARHRTLALFTCQKTRQYPAGFGTGCCITPVGNDAIADLSRRLVRETEFSGIAEVEFKCDPKDGQFKLMEINPRPGTWITVAPVNGVNTPLVAYADLTATPAPECETQPGNTAWIDGWLDLLYFISSKRRNGSAPPLTWRQWRRSLGNRPEGAYLTQDDPRPGIVYGWRTARLVARALVRKAIPKVR